MAGLTLALAAGWPGSAAQAADKVVVTATGVRTHGAVTTTKYTVGWLLECKYDHTLSDDPIVHPGMPGMAHSHDFYGNSGTNAESTVQSMLAASATSCGTVADTAGYWTPTLRVAGQPVAPHKSSEQIYYRSRYASGVVVEPMPTDLRIVVGNMSAVSLAQNAALHNGDIQWECHGSNAISTSPPSCGKQSLVENIKFPSCWDGVLTHRDDTAHLVYTPEDGRCPSSFPHALPRISLKVRYSVPSGGSITLSSGSVYSAHADFWNTWQPAGLSYLVAKCLNAHISCGTSPIAPTGS